jgi:hypothetical protein
VRWIRRRKNAVSFAGRIPIDLSVTIRRLLLCGAREMTLVLSRSRSCSREPAPKVPSLPSAHGEIIYAEPAAWVRKLPVVEIEVLLTAHEGGEERPIGSYTLVHGGLLHR